MNLLQGFCVESQDKICTFVTEVLPRFLVFLCLPSLDLHCVSWHWHTHAKICFSSSQVL